MVKINNINSSNISMRQNYRPMAGDFAVPTTLLPVGQRNYCLFNQNRVNFLVSQGKSSLPYLKDVLQTSKDEREIVEALYILDRMADKGVKGIPAMYPALAKFNDTKSPNIQVFLAGIYRKTQVPDAFGPLVAMLIRNSSCRASMPDLRSNKEMENGKLSLGEDGKAADEAIQKENISTIYSPLTINHSLFDPNEEIGGAILEYIKNYSQGPKVIDFSA